MLCLITDKRFACGAVKGVTFFCYMTAVVSFFSIFFFGIVDLLMTMMS